MKRCRHCNEPTLNPDAICYRCYTAAKARSSVDTEMEQNELFVEMFDGPRRKSTIAKLADIMSECGPRDMARVAIVFAEQCDCTQNQLNAIESILLDALGEDEESKLFPR